MTDRTLLHLGDPFPALTVTLPGGRTVHLADDLAGRFGVVLFYRASWCPYCNAQLSAFQRALAGLAEADAPVVALPVDDEAATRDLIARRGLRFPAGHRARRRRGRRCDRRSSTPARPSCSRPGSCSTAAAGSSSASTPAAPSGGSSRQTSSASSATCADTPRPAVPLSGSEPSTLRTEPMSMPASVT
jgi:thiol-disulfide isomerase/thioredoxin